jgi:hypothetical protein
MDGAFAPRYFLSFFGIARLIVYSVCSRKMLKRMKRMKRMKGMTNMKRQIEKKVLISAVFGFLVTGSALAGITDPLQNGGFSDGLNYWDGLPPAVPGIEGNVTWLPSYYGLDVAWFQESVPDSILRQAFMLPADASSLDITAYMISNSVSGHPSYDSFSAFLRDPVTLDPIINVPGEEFFYSWNHNGMAQQVGIGGPFQQVGPYISVDVSAYGGQSVLLEFGLFSYDLPTSTYALLDEVSVTGGYSPPIVPVPVSWLLCASGATLVAFYRKRLV